MTIVARLFWRTQRVEVATLAVATLVLAVVALVAAAWLAGLTTPTCAALLWTGYTPDQLARCPGLTDFGELRGLAVPLSDLIALVPTVAGIVLGAGLVARELDAGTLQLTWSLEPTRRRWLVERLVVGGLVVGAIGVVAAIVSAPLAAAENLGANVGASFLAYGLWGPLLLFRGLAAFAAGVLAGSLVGRVLPALLVSTLFAMIVVFGALAVAPATYPTELTMGIVDRTALVASVGEVGADGGFLSLQAALARAPAGLSEADRYAWLDAHYRPAATFIAGSEMAGVALREGLLLAGGTVVAIGLASIIVARRRPL